MSYQYPPPPPAPPGYAPAPQPQYGAPAPAPSPYPPQPQYGAPPAQPASSGWVDNRTIIGGWQASQYGMQTGKHIEYKVLQQPTSKGGLFKSVEFFKPFQKKNGQMGEGRNFSFNQMKELVERINHFQNTYGEEKGYFIWQPAAPTMGIGNPYPQQPPPPPQRSYPSPQPQYGAPPQPQPMFPAPQIPPVGHYPPQPMPYPPQQPPAQPQTTAFVPQSSVPPGGIPWP